MALPTAGTGVDGIIADFIAPSKGTYYVQVTGAASLSYDLVVTRGADFDSPPNNQSIAQAQSLQGPPVALGYAGVTNLLASGGAKAKVPYYVDYNFGNDPFGQPFTALGITPTVASSYSDFESDLSSGSWDLVVLLNQGYDDPTWETPLVNYVDGGGHAIVASWTDPQDVAAAFVAPLIRGTTINRLSPRRCRARSGTGCPTRSTYLTLVGGSGRRVSRPRPGNRSGRSPMAMAASSSATAAARSSTASWRIPPRSGPGAPVGRERDRRDLDHHKGRLLLGLRERGRQPHHQHHHAGRHHRKRLAIRQ